jgi:hypothetical protein
MNRRILLWYQILVAGSDTLTGILLIAAPGVTLRLMRLHAPESAMPYVSFVGTFVIAVGIACIYGARLMACRGCTNRQETVWLLTAVTRGMVALFLLSGIVVGTMEPGWLTVAVFDGACAAIQTYGLRKEWLKNVAF